jgi:hypothetical protein
LKAKDIIFQITIYLVEEKAAEGTASRRMTTTTTIQCLEMGVVVATTYRVPSAIAACGVDFSSF